MMLSNGDQVKKLTAKIKAKDACSACCENLIHALKKIDDSGQLDRIAGMIKVGRGYQGENFSGIGIGNCCSGADKYVKGCPPTAKEILDFLIEEEIISAKKL